MNVGRKMDRIDRALAALAGHEEDCRLCPRECRVNRAAGARGFCESGPAAVVSHALLHFGEEPVLSGPQDAAGAVPPGAATRSGSGTVFFSGCSLKCRFCQNYQLSWLGRGREVRDGELAGLMLGLQEKGALNINLVSPTHHLLSILRALKIALDRGLSLPIVANSSGYEKASILAYLEGIVDLYLPDFKYASAVVSARYSRAADYFSRVGEAIREMFYQKPLLILDEAGVALEGLIVRHLVLPGQVEDSLAILDWIARELGTSVALSLMSQFVPCFRSPVELQRPLAPEEFDRVLAKAQELSFEHLFVQPRTFAEEAHLVPDFDLDAPFSWAGPTRQRKSLSGGGLERKSRLRGP
jgi:putative pyruvate formate lyase activating enzyme